MENREFAIAVNKFFYFAMNFTTSEITYPSYDGMRTEYLPSFFNAFEKHLIEHIKGKWDSAFRTGGAYGAMFAFYADLDGENRAKFLAWVNENYKQRDTFGISLENI